MGRKKEQKEQEVTRHPLLVYRNLGKRYRPVGIVFMFMGILSFLPVFISDLEDSSVDSGSMAAVGVTLLLVGAAFWLFAILAIRRSYVQIKPDLLEIRAPFYRTVMSYRRIKQAQSVQVGQLFPRESIKGASKPLVLPLLAGTGVEVHVTSWPTPKKRLMRFMGPYLFSPRTDAWFFIVPDYSAFIRQLDVATQRKLEANKNIGGQYEDPIERLKYYKS
jgi:hypothetical protein